MNIVFLSHMYLDDESYMIGIIWFCDKKKNCTKCILSLSTLKVKGINKRNQRSNSMTLFSYFIFSTDSFLYFFALEFFHVQSTCTYRYLKHLGQFLTHHLI